jgi:hypothetical protein
MLAALFLTYAIFINGLPSGTETVTRTIDKEGNLVAASQHELSVSHAMEAKRVAFATELILRRETLSPVRYSCRYTTGARDAYDVVVKDGAFTRILTRAGHRIEGVATLDSDVLVTDPNVYTHYEFLVRKYDFKKRGRQIFRSFVPLIGTDIEIALSHLNDTRIDLDKEPLAVRNFKLEFVGMAAAALTTDMSGALVRLAIPGQGLEVLRVADPR